MAGTMSAQDHAQDDPNMVSTPNAKVLDDNAISGITNGQGSSQGKGGFWGYAFGDYAYMGSGDSAGRGTKQQYKGLGAAGQNSGQNAFEIRRAYLGYDIAPDKKFSGCVLLAYEGDQDVNDNRTMYMKYAYFKWKNIFKGSDLKIGQQATTSFASAYNTEPLMQYRAVEKTIMDMHGVDGSSDMGINLGGKIVTFHGDSTKFPAFIGYNVMVGDNSGNNPVAYFTGNATSLSGASFSSPSTSTSTSTSSGGITTTTTTKTTTTTSATLNPANNTTDNAKKFRMNLFVNALNGALTVGGYMDFINYGNTYYGTAKGYQKAVMTEKAYAVYNHKWFGIGVEWFQQTMTNGEVETTYGAAKNTVDTTTATQTGLSIFAHGTIIQNCLNLFVRYDMYTADNAFSYSYNAASTLANHANETFTEGFSNTSSTTPYKESFMTAGVDWTPYKDKKIHLMPNIWYYNIKNAYGSDNLASANYMLYRLTFLFAF